jgi:hypothetical protein
MHNEFKDAPIVPQTDPVKDKAETPLLRKLGLPSGVTLFRSPDGKTFAEGAFGRGREAVRIESEHFANALRLHLLRTTGDVPKVEVIRSLQGICHALAFEKPPRAANLRVAEKEGKLFLDLADSLGRCVEVGPDGWTVREDSPILFYRPKSMGALPVPVLGGNLNNLGAFVNVSQGDLQLIIAYTLAVLAVRVPTPALILVGEPGSAKTTTARIIKMLVDPAVGSGTPLPVNDREMAIAAGQELVLHFDNVTSISANCSDTVCRVVTGSGFRTRKLYSDDDQSVFESRRPVIMTAVHNPVARVDLASRSLIVEPPRLTGSGRRDEQELYREFELQRAASLGALLTLLSRAMSVTEVRPLGGDFRMRDFAGFAVKVEQAAGWPEGSVSSRLLDNAANMREDMVEANVVSLMLGLFTDAVKFWTGTAGTLFQWFANNVPRERHRELPTNLAIFTRQIMEVAPLLRERGIEVTKTRTGAARLITIRKIEDRPSQDCTPDGDAMTPMTPTT